MKVLIVDDSKVLRERLVEMLSQVTGLEIVGQAKNTAEALSAIKSARPDLVILDLQMPDGNGMDVLRKARQTHPGMQVIIFTNHPETQYKQRCTELGADYFFCKSTDSSLLIETAEVLAAGEGTRHETTREEKREQSGDDATAAH